MYAPFSKRSRNQLIRLLFRHVGKNTFTFLSRVTKESLFLQYRFDIVSYEKLKENLRRIYFSLSDLD